jgi:CHAT domain-containing protein
MTPPDLVEQLLALPDIETQKQFLEAHASALDDEVAGTLKDEATRLLRSDVQRSLETTDLVFHVAELTHNPLHRALGLLAEANARSIGGLGEYQLAVELYDEAAEVYQSNGRPVEQASSQIGKVFSLAMLGRYDEAVTVGDWASQVLEEHRQWHLLVNLAMNLAIVHGRQRQDAEALARFDRARAFCGQLGSDGIASLQLVEHNRAIVLRNLGQFDASIQASRAALDLAEQLGHKIETGRVQENLAFTYLLLGRYNEALELMDRVRDISLSDGRQSHAIAIELVITDCLLQLRRFDDVLDKCHQLQNLFTEQGLRREEADATLNEALAYVGQHRYTEALASLAKARHLFDQEGNNIRVASVDLETAAVLHHQNQFEESLTVAQKCADVFQAHDLPVPEAQSYLSAARSAAALNRHEQARRLLTEALVTSEDKGVPSLTYQCRHTLGAVTEAQGDLDGALAEYDRAVEALEWLRGRLMIEYRADFLADKQIVYEDLVSLCLDLDQPLRGLEYAERAKSRALLDMLANRIDLSVEAREVEDAPLVEELTKLRAERDRLSRRWQSAQGLNVRGWEASSEAQLEAQQEVLTLEKQITDLWHKLLIRNADYARDAALWQVRTEPVQPYLAQGTLLLEYFIARGQLVAFLVTAEAVRVQRLSTDLAEIQRLLQHLGLNLRAVPRSSPNQIRNLATNAQGLLQRFYELLIAPLMDTLTSYSQLIIVPHGSLHYLPFHALYNGQSFLLEKFAISYLPGASLLRYCQEARPAATEHFAIGHSYDSALPYTLEEVQIVADLLGGKAVLEDEATTALVRKIAPSCRILHLATHGDFRPDNPLFSGLALADGWLTTLDAFNLPLRTSLVTLSACQTGRNVVSGGDELLGLMRAFLYAGAASLVLSLWVVEDRSTAQLMETFYRKLADGCTKGAALRHAQLQFIEERSNMEDAHDESHTHPYFWAPFFLVGDAGSL